MHVDEDEGRMAFDTEEILSVLDSCCEASTFPMLDNGYVSLRPLDSPCIDRPWIGPW